MKARLPVIMFGLVVTGVAGVASGPNPPCQHHPGAKLHPAARGAPLGLCAQIRQAGINVTVPDCVRQILFANRDWFAQRFGYVWKDPSP